MKETTKQIIELRTVGKTYSEISSELGIAKGTISYTCKKYVLDNVAIVQNNNNLRTYHPDIIRMKAGAAKYYDKLRAVAKTKWAKRLATLPKEQVAYMAGLYDGEGNHSATEFAIANAAPEIVWAIRNFLETLGAKYTAKLAIHASHCKEDCIRFWDLTFSAVYQAKPRAQQRDYSAKENYGTVHFRVIQPLGLREAIHEYSLAYNKEQPDAWPIKLQVQ